jgi:hypothetical protein
MPLMIAGALGFLAVVAGGVAFRVRGRGLAAAVLGGGLLLTGALAAWLDGREGVHAWSVGLLVGLPVLVGCAVAYERAARRTT